MKTRIPIVFVALVAALTIPAVASANGRTCGKPCCSPRHHESPSSLSSA